MSTASPTAPGSDREMTGERQLTDAAARVLEHAKRNGLTLVRILWCGNDGVVRAKATTVAALPRRLENGVGGTAALQAMNALDRMQVLPDAVPAREVRLMPDPVTFRILPYAPRTGALLGDHVRQRDALGLGDYFRLDGGPEAVCQRTFLRRMEGRLAERDTVLRVGFENEFSLATRNDGRLAPLERAPALSTIALTASQDYADALVTALEAQGIAIEQYYAEAGRGQQELSVAHRGALRAADEQIFVRESIRGVASSLGLVASLAPRPWLENDVGNGSHVHFSLWSGEGRSRFHTAGPPDSLSGEARGFLAGVLEHLPGLCGLTAPSFNSYPQPWGGGEPAWTRGRGAPLRVRSSASREGATSAEFVCVDASCNPYLALGGLIAAGIDGLVRGLLLPEPIDDAPPPAVDGEQVPPDVGPEASSPQLPSTQSEALDALEADEVLMDALGPSLAQSYLAVRRSEWDVYSTGNSTQEQQGHFLTY
jgi:glutamine synthetase